MGKALNSCVGGAAPDSLKDRREWTEIFLPQGSAEQLAAIHDLAAAQEQTWAAGDASQAKKAMMNWMRETTREKRFPKVTFAPDCAPGPSGERYEHFVDCMASKEFGPWKRLQRALDNFTLLWALGRLPAATRWIMDTSAI